jgi:phosphate transport system permease protein
MNQPQAKLWVPPAPTLGQTMMTAVRRSSIGAAILSVLFFAVKFLIRVLAEPGNGSFVFLFGQSLYFFGAAWALLFPIVLIIASRAASNAAFTVSGFLATFFGLAILAVFFFHLAGEVVLWFRYTPMLVELENERNQKELAVLSDSTKTAARKRALLTKSEKERDDALSKATTEAEKKEIGEEYAQALQQQALELDKTLAEDRQIAERSLRTDQSPTGILFYFLSNSPSNSPQDAGIAPALVGSVWLGLITILFAVPIGVGAALYLEEYRTEGWLAKIIQININNLAGVPSVVFGILGGFVFVYISKQLQEAHPSIAARNLLGGGLTLGLLTLPLIIVSAQEAIRAVPGSLRQGAYALGATKWQVMWTIVLPMARPGIMTGTILSLSRAIGEAAPLVLFGAQLFVDQVPWPNTRFTALPMQIFNWCDRPPYEVQSPDGPVSIDIWKYNAAVASTVLLIVLLGMNAVAIFLRNRARQNMRY